MKSTSRRGGRELRRGVQGAPLLMPFGSGPFMHEDHQSINQSLAHTSHVETGDGRQPGRESASPLPSDRVGQRREHRETGKETKKYFRDFGL